ncbi:Pentatricopeptide repeat-containing protein [Nymphaea thermarum]|nr:Pentatricopeptide repeat-containing protein [Nymphaea thermarum]
MKIEGTKPNEVTSIGVLDACSHSDLLDGHNVLESMKKRNGTNANVHYYCCMVNLHGRAGQSQIQTFCHLTTLAQ